MIKFSNTHGLEIKSWVVDGHEIMYQKNGSWNKTDPFLFPSIGVSAKPIDIDGDFVKHPRHGLFVNSEYEFKQLEKNVWSFDNIPGTNYFNYEFNITKQYIENENELEVSTVVTNNDINHFKYQMGYHGAFIIDDDSKIKFDNLEYNIHEVNDDGFVSDNTIKFVMNNNEWTIDFEVFKKMDSLVFGESQIKKLELINNNYKLMFEFSKNIKAVTIWTISNENDENKYICIEPWSNIPTTLENENVELLEPNKSNEFTYKIIYKKMI